MAEISKTADQALAVLLAVSESQPCTPAQLSRDLRMNRTVVHRLLTTLHRRGFVIRQDDGYAPGPMLIRLADSVESELAEHGRMAVAQLSETIGETVVLHVRDSDDAVVLLQAVSSRHVVRVEHRIGSRHSLLAGASGRAILAFLEEKTAERITGKAEHPETARRQVEGVRHLGYALSHDELQLGVHGVAVPIVDEAERALASLAVLVPTSRTSAITHHIDALLEAGVKLSATLSLDSPRNR
ncbi:IclR family transcriptional regulator [Streptomyces malaysiensis]|uniref:IclR family transcriptional regulator n=1 Tax=Streptomyces malaysiensis TaxID=92644 RepID=UPI002B2E806B|nr:IclR family transcriptional regulator [Streptomyces malaysiensis]